MQFNSFVQGNFYRVIEALNTGIALRVLGEDIAAGLVPNFNPALPHNIVLSPVTSPEFVKWAAQAPANPRRFDVWAAPDGSAWIYDQPRGRDGRYIADDPSTPVTESALQWIAHS